jgi:hypothetical protein
VGRRRRVTRDERTAIRFAINTAKRGWIHQQGGFKHVEADAKGQDLVLARMAKGSRTRLELEAENTELRRRLRRAYNRISETRRSRDVWKKRAMAGKVSKLGRRV